MRPGEHVFSRVLDTFSSESVFASTLTYIFEPATHFGRHALGGGANTLNFSALSNNLDLVVYDP